VNTYQPAPAGMIEAEIVAASIGEVKWKASDANPRGECLRLRLSAGREFAFIFADVPLDWDRMLENVRAAAGVSSDHTPEEYMGVRVRVVLKHYTAKDGSIRASVAKWLPCPMPVSDGKPITLVDAVNAWAAQGEPKQPAAVKPPAAVKRSRNAPPTFGSDDDIPF
jgi:hypothetical protein